MSGSSHLPKHAPRCDKMSKYCIWLCMGPWCGLMSCSVFFCFKPCDPGIGSGSTLTLTKVQKMMLKIMLKKWIVQSTSRKNKKLPFFNLLHYRYCSVLATVWVIFIEEEAVQCDQYIWISNTRGSASGAEWRQRKWHRLRDCTAVGRSQVEEWRREEEQMLQVWLVKLIEMRCHLCGNDHSEMKKERGWEK